MGFWPAYTIRGVPSMSGVCLIVGLGVMGWGLFFLFIRGGLEIDHETKALRFRSREFKPSPLISIISAMLV